MSCLLTKALIWLTIWLIRKSPLPTPTNNSSALLTLKRFRAYCSASFNVAPIFTNSASSISRPASRFFSRLCLRNHALIFARARPECTKPVAGFNQSREGFGSLIHTLHPQSLHLLPDTLHPQSTLDPLTYKHSPPSTSSPTSTVHPRPSHLQAQSTLDPKQ